MAQLGGVLAAIGLWGLAASAGQGATVVSIGDGDTLRLRQGPERITVRLACVDAPETSQAPDGLRARRQLESLVPLGSVVELRQLAIDRYGRHVAELRLDGRNVNQALVASGAVFVYWRYIRGCDRQTYGQLERQARLHRLGVWRLPGGITRPWDHRGGQRRQDQGSR